MTKAKPFPRLKEAGSATQQRLLNAAADDGPPAELEATLYQALKLDASSSQPQTVRKAAAETLRTPRRGSPASAGALLVAAAALLLVYFESRRSEDAPVDVAREPTPTTSDATRPAASIKPELRPHHAPRCPSALKAAGLTPLVDDLEDKNSRLLPNEERTGFWYTFNDGSGKQQPLSGPVSPSTLHPARGASKMAIHAQGDALSGWGATVGFGFGDRICYDASVYAGLEFWARGQGRIAVFVKMLQTVPKAEGGTCESNCYDGHSKYFILTPEFKKYTLLWSDLKQRGYGEAFFFDPGSLAAVDFAVGAEDTPYDFWVDDVAFVKAEPGVPTGATRHKPIPRMTPTSGAH